jgi:site-specific recombinase XerD
MQWNGAYMAFHLDKYGCKVLMRIDLLESSPMMENHPAVAVDDLLSAPMGNQDQHPVAVYLARLAPGSRRSQKAALEGMASILTGGRLGVEELPWNHLRYQHTQALRTVLAERFSPATANRHLAALRGVLREAWRLGLMSAEELQRAIDLPAVRGERLVRGRALSRGELRALFESCRAGTAADLRDAALIGVLYATGLRRAEVVSLVVADYDAETGALIVRGKGNKERIAYIDDGAAEAMGEWRTVRGDEPGPLFCPVSQIGEITVRQMSDQAVYAILQSRAKKAKVRPFSPHDLRRSCVSDLLDAGVDISIVQQFVGHANVNTTARYDRRGEHAKRRAAKSLHVPFVVDDTAVAL